MNVIICGAGEVGTHCAERLTAAGYNITVIDMRPERLEPIEEHMDVRTLLGNSANADVLREAGANDEAAALVAATSSDEVNLLTATVAKGVGVGKCFARVHHSAYFNERGLDYATHLKIDRLICPEYSTAQAIASTLRSPGALAIENFAAGTIEIQEFPIAQSAPAAGKSLIEIKLPPGVRLAAIRRGAEVSLPTAESVINPGDVIILVGNSDVFPEARSQFSSDGPGRRRLAIMGGSAISVWICRALRDRAFSIRLFETDRARAEELADKLDWVTVLQADPTEVSTFDEEHLADADVFAGMTDDDEQNILGCAWAKSSGVKQAIAVVQRQRYLELIGRVGIDYAFSPRQVAVRQIERSLDDSPLLRMASLAEGVVDVYRVRVGADAPAAGKSLRHLKLSPDWMIAVMGQGESARVPTADDVIRPGETVMVIGRSGAEQRLKTIFNPR